MSVNLDRLNSSMQRLLSQQREVVDRQERSVICELSDLTDRIGEISMPEKVSSLRRFFNWTLSLFGRSPNKAKERAHLDATLAHLAGRTRKNYPIHERPTAREMIAKIFHVRRELLTPLRAHFPNAHGLTDLDALLLHSRDRYGSRIADEAQEMPQQRRMTPSTQPASINVNAGAWVAAHREAGYDVKRTASGHIIAEKGRHEPEIIAPDEIGGGYEQICNFARGVTNKGNHPENPSFTVSWVNGVNTRLTKTIKRAEEISSELRAPVNYLHNPKKSLISHLEDSRSYLAGKNTTEEVLALAHHLRTLLAQSDREILHICHSQGAALTKLAAKHLSAGEKARIHVRSFGGLMPIEPGDGFGSQQNYISKGDALIKTLNKEASRATSRAARGEATEHYLVLEKAKNAKKSHSISANSPYHNAMKLELAEWRRAH